MAVPALIRGVGQPAVPARLFVRLQERRVADGEIGERGEEGAQPYRGGRSWAERRCPVVDRAADLGGPLRQHRREQPSLRAESAEDGDGFRF
jgi:hypothetical protein